MLAATDLDGLPYFTMPYVEGESLRARLGRWPLSIAEAVRTNLSQSSAVRVMQTSAVVAALEQMQAARHGAYGRASR